MHWFIYFHNVLTITLPKGGQIYLKRKRRNYSSPSSFVVSVLFPSSVVPSSPSTNPSTSSSSSLSTFATAAIESLPLRLINSHPLSSSTHCSQVRYVHSDHYTRLVNDHQIIIIRYLLNGN